MAVPPVPVGRPPARVPYERGYELPELMERVSDDHLGRRCFVAPLRNMTQVRDFLNEHAYVPFRYVFADITGATEAAQNALLKFLEEPPAAPTIYVFHELTWQPLETVASRCAVHPVIRLSVEHKEQILRAEGLNTGRVKDWDRPLSAIRIEIDPAAGAVAEFLEALSNKDVVATLSASRGFRGPEVTVLLERLREHLMGEQAVEAFRRTPAALLSAWATVLETAPPGLAVRWGALEVIAS